MKTTVDGDFDDGFNDGCNGYKDRYMAGGNSAEYERGYRQGASGCKSPSTFLGKGERMRAQDTILGDEITDKKTVASVQRQLHALAQATGNSDFDPYHDKYRDDGVIGSHTRDAVAAFNKAYGWPDDGDKITSGTLKALTRPDVVSANRAAASHSEEDANTAARVKTEAAQSKAEAEVLKAKAAAQSASTPEEKKVAEARLEKAQDKLDAAKADVQSTKSFLQRETFGGLKMWQVFLGAGGVLAVGVAGFLMLRGRSSGQRRSTMLLRTSR